MTEDKNIQNAITKKQPHPAFELRKSSNNPAKKSNKLAILNIFKKKRTIILFIIQ